MTTDMDFASFAPELSQPEISNYELSSSQHRLAYDPGYMYSIESCYPGLDGSMMSADAALDASAMSGPSPIDPMYAISESGSLSPPWTLADYVGYNGFVGMPVQTPISPPPEDSNACEYLGISKLQAHSRLSKQPRQPRAIRPSNERAVPQDSEDEDSLARDDSSDKVKARSDPLYDMKPDRDGFYHCPKKDESNCNHQPTKQKCIFA
jgi:hypothetical protein